MDGVVLLVILVIRQQRQQRFLLHLLCVKKKKKQKSSGNMDSMSPSYNSLCVTIKESKTNKIIGHHG